MENSVNQRVVIFAKSHNISNKALSGHLNINEKTLGHKLSGHSKIDIDTILTLLDTFKDLSAEWLLRGTGPMERCDDSTDAELKAMYIEQGREIFRLKQRIAELEGEKKEGA